MFPFLLIFIVFVCILAYYSKKGSAKQKKVTEEFWEKERQSNAVRKKNISNLDYITIPLEKFPQKFETPSEEAFFSFTEKTMLNLTGISNTDLKLTYGTANLNILSEYDTNFADMIAVLPQYAAELIEAGEADTAKDLLEFAISCNADSAKIYKQLADIYHKKGEDHKIKELLEKADTLPTYTKSTVENELSVYFS